MSDLVKRLRGKYSVGPKGVLEDRDFGDFTPRITIEAADRIEFREKEIDSLKNHLKAYNILKSDVEFVAWRNKNDKLLKE